MQPQENGVRSGPLPSRPPMGAAAFTAYAEPIEQQQRAKRAMWKVWLVAGDCFLIGLQPVLVHMSKSSDGQFAFNPVSVNFLVEVVKTVFALVVLLIYGTGRPGAPMYRNIRSFIRDAFHNKLLAIPALLYAINNYIKFVMQLYFKPTTAKMLGNLKILAIAVLMKWIMHRSFSIYQWEALYLLVAGVTMNQLNHCTSSTTITEQLAPAAIAYTAGSITIPSLASVYNEFALKRHMDTSVHLQNFFLYFYGMVFNFVGVTSMLLLQGHSMGVIFKGHSKVTMLLVVNNALQGILSSFFFKYADTILKKYSSTVATIFTAIMSAVLFGKEHHLTINFCMGVSIVFISMHIFFSQGGAKGLKEKATLAQRLRFSPSMDHLNVRSDSESSLASLDNVEGAYQPVLKGHKPILPR